MVTGAFGSLGIAVARAFREQGAAVALLGRGQPPLPVAAQFPAPHCVLGGVDLTQVTGAGTAMETVRATLGPSMSSSTWPVVSAGRPLSRGVSKVGTRCLPYLKTAIVSTKAALPQLLASPAGRIINVGSGAAARPAGAGMGAYAASKAGVHKLTESLAEELKDRGITVNAVLPGIIDTPRNRADMPNADFSRWVQPEAIAAVIAFLASQQAAAVTGALVPVYGRG